MIFALNRLQLVRIRNISISSSINFYFPTNFCSISKVLVSSMSSSNVEPEENPPGKDVPDDIDEVKIVKEGNVTIEYHKKFQAFYNPTQEVNRDISILAIQTFINQEKKEDVTIFEAMAASGIRAIRYGKEITNLKTVIANDVSYKAIESIKLNTKLNNVENIIVPNCGDAKIEMYANLVKTPPLVIDLDPYGTPTPFIDGAVQCIQNGGLLCVTATDVAILCGNHPEACYAKYGSMSMRNMGCCHEMALRILIHAVQSSANTYGRYVIPLVSLSIDFYVRIFFKVVKSAEIAKNTASQTSLVFRCVGCHNINLQHLGKKTEKKHGLNMLSIDPKCENCESRLHMGGPIWSGPLHDKDFVKSMIHNLNGEHFYLNTSNRIRGLLTIIKEEVEVPLFYKISELSAAIKVDTMPVLTMMSALMNLGYSGSISHCQANSVKTNAPNKVLWDIFKTYYFKRKKDILPPEGSLAHIILSKPIETKDISLEKRNDAIPKSREERLVRFQINPQKFWGPGTKSTINTLLPADKMIRNQGKRKDRFKNGKKGAADDSKIDGEPNTKDPKLDVVDI